MTLEDLAALAAKAIACDPDPVTPLKAFREAGGGDPAVVAALVAVAETAETIPGRYVKPWHHGNSPGHGHAVPGVWDDDNGDMAGQPCEQCAEWCEFIAALQRLAEVLRG